MRYKLFGRGTGLRVAELALGCGNFGTRWGYGAELEDSRRMFDMYVDAGGNFIDTADGYQFGQSEEFLSEFIGERRDDLVLGTKFSMGESPNGVLLQVGNSRKNLVRSVEASLRRLKTDRIDLLWAHIYDADTSSDELMRGLDDLVRAGKILYLGLSNFTAWHTARAQTIAELRGWAPIVGQQVEYSLVARSADRELLPMAEALGIGTVGYRPLGGGLLSGKYRRGEVGRATTLGIGIHSESDAQKIAVVDALFEVAEEAGVTATVAALAWMGARGVIPILGPRTSQQLQDSLAAADLDLTPAQIAKLDAASAVELGFPHDVHMDQSQRTRLAGGMPERVETTAVRLP